VEGIIDKIVEGLTQDQPVRRVSTKVKVDWNGQNICDNCVI